jgi:hypothetical protein
MDRLAHGATEVFQNGHRMIGDGWAGQGGGSGWQDLAANVLASGSDAASPWVIQFDRIPGHARKDITASVS